MARDDVNAPVKNHQLGQDPMNQCIIVAPAVVSPSDGPGKEGIAAEENLLLPLKEADSSGSMARGGDNLEIKFPDLNDVRLLYIYIPAHVAIPLSTTLRDTETETSAQFHVGFFQNYLLFAGHVDWNIEFFSCLDHAGNMVEMGMRQHYAYWMQALVFYMVKQLVPFLGVVESRVDYCAFAFVVPNQRASLLKGIEYEKMSMYHQNQNLFTKIRKELLNLSPV